MRKKILLIILSIVTCLSVSPIYAKDALELDVPYAYVYSPKYEQVLYSKNEYETMIPASLTKMMTVLVAIENLDDLSQKAEIKTEYLAYALKMHASLAGFEEHEMVTYEDLLYGAMLRSGAEACIALAEATSGSEEAFVEKMNEKCAQIGMDNTKFQNPTGLEATDHYSTAHDLSLLLDYALKNPTFRKVFTTEVYKTPDGKHTLNSVKRKYAKKGLDTSCMLGSKTGYEDNAGYCIASLIKSGDEELIVIIGKDKSREAYIKKLKKIADYYQSGYTTKRVTYIAQKLGTVKTNGFLFNKFRMRSTEFRKLYVEKGVEEVTFKVEPFKDLETIEKGDHIADITFYASNKEIATISYYAPYSLTTSYLIQGGIILIYILLVLLVLLLILLFARKIYRIKRRKQRAKKRAEMQRRKAMLEQRKQQ